MKTKTCSLLLTLLIFSGSVFAVPIYPNYQYDAYGNLIDPYVNPNLSTNPVFNPNYVHPNVANPANENLALTVDQLYTPSVIFQNDTDKIMTGGYHAVITNKNHQTRNLEDTFPVPPGTTTTPALPGYLNHERLFVTAPLNEHCTSTVVFNLEQRGGAFGIVEGSSMGKSCFVRGTYIALFGTVLRDGFTILLLEKPAPAPRHVNVNRYP